MKQGQTTSWEGCPEREADQQEEQNAGSFLNTTCQCLAP